MVKLHQKSINYMNELFSLYTNEAIGFDLKLDECVVHLYAVEDTYDENGDLNGYHDSLLFKCDIYDIVNMKKYSCDQYHDSIDIMDNIVYPSIKIFKDGSTMLRFTKGVCFTFAKSIGVWNKDKFK